MKTDYLIVGQGLAGSLLAWHLLDLGCRVLVVDRDEAETSSKVAAGLVNPLAGARFNLPVGLEERLDYARKFYWNREDSSGSTFFHHRRIARLFRSPQEGEMWRARLEGEPERYARFHSPLAGLPDSVRTAHGGFEMRESGWLDVPAFLEHTRQNLLERLSYAIATVRSDEVLVTNRGVRWKNVEASSIVFCEGWRGNQNRFFDWVPMNAAVGDILDLEIPSLGDESRILNGGGWVIPLGGGRFRAGSTYRHDTESGAPCLKGREEVVAKVAGLVAGSLRVTGHRAAIRPTMRRSQVFMGLHPGLPRVVFFNGLGSKGVLNGPWHAKRLAEGLVHGADLPPASDLRSNTF